MNSVIECICFGDIARNSFSFLFDSIWRFCDENNKKKLLYSIIYLRSPRLGSGNESLGVEAAIAFFRKDPDFFLAHLTTYLDLTTWKDAKRFLCIGYDEQIIEIWAQRLQEDMDSMRANRSVSLAAKWFPSEHNTVDRHSCCWSVASKYLKISKKQLRKDYIVPLRFHLNIPERHIVLRDFSKVNYTLLSRRSRNKYHDLFMQHDRERYLNFLNAQEWTWIPTSYWSNDTLPKAPLNIPYIPEVLGSLPASSGIMIIVDDSALMSPVIVNIAKKYVSDMLNRRLILLAPYSNPLNTTFVKTREEVISKIDEYTSKWEHSEVSIETHVNIRLGIKSLKEKYSDLPIIIISCGSRLVAIDASDGISLWWSVSHNPVNISESKDVSLISGYSLDLYNLLVTKGNPSIKREFYTTHVLNRIHMEVSALETS